MSTEIISLMTENGIDYVVNKDGDKVKLESLFSKEGGESKRVGLYFSAHWCPPCRYFTPQLSEIYQAVKKEKGDDFEIIFISSDQDAKHFEEYHSTMPWLALPFESRKAKAAISEKFGVRGIPTLVLLDGAGNTVTTQGRAVVMLSEPKEFPWVDYADDKLETIMKKKREEAEAASK